MVKKLFLLFYISHVAIIFRLRILLLIPLLGHFLFVLESGGQVIANEGINSFYDQRVKSYFLHSNTSCSKPKVGASDSIHL